VIGLKVDPRNERAFILPVEYHAAKEYRLRTLLAAAPELFAECGGRPKIPGAEVISDRYRVPVVAQRRTEGGVVLRRGAHKLVLSNTELDRLVKFARTDARLQIYRYP